MKKVKLLLLLLFLASNLHAQDSTFFSLKKKIKSDLIFLMKKTFVSQRDATFNEEEYCRKVGQKIQKLLTLEESRAQLELSDFYYNKVPFLKLAVYTNDKRNVRIYNYGYDCGGTRGWVTHPIIQYTNELGQLYTYNMSNEMNSDFFKIYLLQDDLYLLLGSEKGSGACQTQTACVIQFKGNYLILDYSAFMDKFQISFCNTTSSFSEETKTLTIKAPFENHNGEKRFNSFVFSDPYRYLEEAERKRWYSYLRLGEGNSIKLKFNSGRFYTINHE